MLNGTEVTGIYFIALNFHQTKNISSLCWKFVIYVFSTDKPDSSWKFLLGTIAEKCLSDAKAVTRQMRYNYLNQNNWDQHTVTQKLCWGFQSGCIYFTLMLVIFFFFFFSRISSFWLSLWNFVIIEKICNVNNNWKLLATAVSC